MSDHFFPPFFQLLLGCGKGPVIGVLEGWDPGAAVSPLCFGDTRCWGRGSVVRHNGELLFILNTEVSRGKENSSLHS